MTLLADRRRPVDIIRARFLFNRRNASALFAVVMLRLIWSANKYQEVDSFTTGLASIWRTSSHLLVACVLMGIAALVMVARRVLPKPKTPVYLMDTYCYKGPDQLSLKVPHAGFIEQGRTRGVWGEESLAFMERLLQSSGLGNETYLPETIVAPKMDLTWTGALKETELVCFSIVDDLFKQSGVRPEQIDILIVVCSCFAPTPSIASMIVNKLKLRTDILSHNIAGMGCSAGVIGVDMANMMLQAKPDQRVLLVCHENMTINNYQGDNRSCLVSNCLFRMGGAASIISNVRADRHKAKYELMDVVRSHLGADDGVFNAIRQLEDEQGLRGILLQKNVVAAASLALKTNITNLAPVVLPIAELAKCALDKGYVPDFKQAFQHFLIHTGGRAVIEEVEKRLELTPEQCRASKDTLHRFGNTCCAAVFYVLTNMEAKDRIKMGDKLWMMGFGTGFKCNSAIWKALRDVSFAHDCWQ